MAKSKTPTIEQVATLLNHPRALTRWVVRVWEGELQVLARITVVYPRDGAGTLRVLVTDWAMKGPEETYGTMHYIARAGGYGYDKLTACLAGTTVGGFTLGDHCDHAGRPTLETLVRSRKWAMFTNDGASGNVTTVRAPAGVE